MFSFKGSGILQYQDSGKAGTGTAAFASLDYTQLREHAASGVLREWGSVQNPATLLDSPSATEPTDCYSKKDELRRAKAIRSECARNECGYVRIHDSVCRSDSAVGSRLPSSRLA